MFIQKRRLGALTVLALAGLAATTLSACASDESTTAASGDTLSVITAFYPLAFASERIGGAKVEVTNLTPPGAEPHDLELTPQQVAQIGAADVVIYVGGFQSAVDEAVAQEAKDTSIDVGKGLTTLAPPKEPHQHGSSKDKEAKKKKKEAPAVADPHIWLDPTLMGTIAERIGTRFADIDAANRETYTANQATLTKDLTTLSEEWTTGTKTCRSRDLVVSHEAFGYLGKAFDFKQVGISGLSPDSEPSAAKIREVTNFVRKNDVTTIYFETLVDPKVAETVAQESGAKTAVLDPLEGLKEGSDEDYLSVMRTNLEAVQAGQGCK